MVVEYVHVWLAQSVKLLTFIKEELQIFAETSVFCTKFFLMR